MRISDWSSDVCSSDLYPAPARRCAWPYRIGRGRPCNKKQKYAVGILCLSRLSGGATPGGNPVLRVARGLPLHRVTQGMGMATTEQSTADTHAETGVRRRDFINIAAVSFAGVGAATAVIPLVNQMNPSADVLALASIEVDVSAIQPGQALKRSEA